MTEPAAFDAETTPAVTLGQQLWPVPELVWSDLKKCRRELIELNDMINAAAAAEPAEAEESPAERGNRQLRVMGQLLDGLSNEEYDRLVMGPVLAALQAAHPTLTKGEFAVLRSTEAERQMAWLTARRQSGLFVFAGGEQPAPGEASGAA
ncbi:MAG: hypothetical protein WA840_01035 [Caulobacteraceae bacterium]